MSEIFIKKNAFFLSEANIVPVVDIMPLDKEQIKICKVNRSTLQKWNP